MMKAFTFLGPGKGAKLQAIAKPKILESTDIIGKIRATTLCGSDHHIIDGFLQVTNKFAEAQGDKGITLGHEGVIEVVEVGSDVKKFKKGDMCIVPAVNSCGTCYYCTNGLGFSCTNDVCFPGIIMDGMLAEFARIPYAERALHKAPEGVPIESLVMLSDVLPTSYEVGIEDKIKTGDRVAILGCGPVGLSALLTLKPFNPSQVICIDINQSRLETAKKLGATNVFNPLTDTQMTEEIVKLTSIGGKKPGVDLVIECAGTPQTIEAAQQLVTVGGTISIVSTGQTSAPINLFELQRRKVSITSGFMSGHSIPKLIELVRSGEIDPSPLISHQFKLEEVEQAYKVFRNANENKTIKVLLRND